ncbi:X-Pro dipeptidyl-peptidase domain-containing protein [Trichoderma austrokoningii]
MKTEKSNRGYIVAALDRFFGWKLGLPSERSSWNVSPVHIPMRDGIKLRGDLYRPMGLNEDASSSRMVVGFTPYGRGFLMALPMAHIYAARGYSVLLVSLRGTFGSEGKFTPGEDETNDTADTVAWMRTQSWYPGRFATVGASFCGWAQWAMHRNSPDDCVASAIGVGPNDFWDWHWGNGVFCIERVLWSNLLATQEKTALIPALMKVPSIFAAAAKAATAFPLRDAIVSLLAEEEPTIIDAMAIPSPEDQFWVMKRNFEALERVRLGMPILLTTGWFDPFTLQTLKQYQRLAERGCNVKLILGPWTHGEAAGVTSDAFELVENAFNGKQSLGDTPLAKIWVSGADEWRTMASWPPASTTIATFYLNSDKTIVNQAPSDTTSSTSFTFNPTDPTPAIGGHLLSPDNAGRVNDSAYAKRADVLVFTSLPIEDEDGIEVLGAPVIELAHSSDRPSTDIWARLSEVDSKGITHNIADGYGTFDKLPDAVETIEIRIRDCAHRFNKGTKICLIVGGGLWPVFARNLGTGATIEIAPSIGATYASAP